MGLLNDIRNKFIIEPIAKRLIDDLEKAKSPEQPAIFQVPYGFNGQMAGNNKQMIAGGVNYETLRALSIRHETVRAAINARKRQISQLEFEISEIDPEKRGKGDASEKNKIKNMFNEIGGPGMRFRDLLDRFMEDTLVLDSLVFYKQKTRGGKLLRIIPIDPATIKLRVDESGARPLPPEIAFEQWIYGKKVAELTTNELVYELMNPRTNTPYGLSPLESLILVVDTSLKAALYNSNYLSDNNIPMGFLTMPESWNVQQIKEYKEFFDSMLSGSKNTSKVFPIPSGTNYQPTTKPNDFSFKDFFDYLDHKICMMFDVTPQELGLNLLQYKENADAQDAIQIRKGLKPLANFLSEIFTDIIRNDWGYDDYCFKFTGYENKYGLEDVKTLLPLGVISIDEVRTDLGLTKLGIDNLIIQGGTVIPVTDEIMIPTPTTTISGTKTPEIKAEEPTIKSETIIELAKIDRLGGGLFKVERKKEFRTFKKNVIEAIKSQIDPFTVAKTIETITTTEKADINQASFDDYFESIDIDGLEDSLKWAGTQGGKEAVRKLNLGLSFTLTNPKYLELLGDRSTYLINSVDNTTKEYLINAISQGKSNGLTNDQIARQINKDMDLISKERAKLIVDTEVANAMGTVEIDTYKEHGVEKQQWITSEDDMVCESCQALDQEIVDVGQSFSDGTDTYPQHPRCRCYINPV